jgi:hypothetical protein
MAHQITIKNQVFTRYLKNEVIAAQDNLARRNWNGSIFCCFCNVEGSIKHLFFACAYARFIWRAVHIVFGIVVPLNTDDLFSN